MHKNEDYQLFRRIFFACERIKSLKLTIDPLKQNFGVRRKIDLQCFTQSKYAT